jgi:DNA-binding MarR family transcriptional regulator
MKKKLSLDDSAGFLVGQLASRLQLQVDRALAAEGVTAPQWTVLWILNAGLAATPSDISDYLSMNTGAVTRLLDRMVDKNLIVRKADEKDRRRILLQITPEAKALYPRLPPLVAEVVKQFFHDIPAEDLTIFKQILLQAINNGDSIRKDSSVTPGSL